MGNTKNDKDHRAKIEERAMLIIRPSVNEIFDNINIGKVIKKGKKNISCQIIFL